MIKVPELVPIDIVELASAVFFPIVPLADVFITIGIGKRSLSIGKV